MQRRISGRSFVAGAALALAALAVALIGTCAGALGGDPDWGPWARPEDLPARGAWSHVFANFVTLRFEDVAEHDIEVRSGTLPPKGMPLRELRFRRGPGAGARCVVSDRDAGNGELVVEGQRRVGRTFRVDAAGRVTPDPAAAGPLEELLDDVREGRANDPGR